MDNQEKSLQHHAFIASTDRKSLYTQLKNLVRQAQEVASKDLEKRRSTLKLLLENEDKIYEEEFANKVKSRIDDDIRERKDNLLKIKEESTKSELEFLKSKRIQQNINSCYEIREALRHKETLYVQECQLEQMLEKEQAFRKEKDFEKYWLDVQNVNLKLLDERQKQEDCLKKGLIQQVTDMRKAQLEELKKKRERADHEKLEEKAKLNSLLEKLRLEAFDSNIKHEFSEKAEYRDELLKMIKEKKLQQEKEYQEQAELHRKLMSEIAREKEEETLSTKAKKKAFYQATMDFINFVKGVRQLEEQNHQMFSNRLEELGRLDMCTKRNILLERERKARIAEQCYAELRQQICDQYKTRLREEAEYRENKMLENRFVHKEISRAEILAKKQKVREELDKQLEELEQIRRKEDAKFSNDLQRASNDHQLCTELAEKYIKEGIDYLEPHPNRNILNFNSREYIAKDTAQSKADMLSRGAVPKKSVLPSAKIVHKIAKDGRGDEKNC